jgi:uncharacterized phage protein (TIGR02220 family)
MTKIRKNNQTSSTFGIVYSAILCSELSISAKGVYAILTKYADKSRYCYPSLSLIQENAKVDIKTLHKYIRELEAANVIEVIRKKGQVNHYRLIEPVLPDGTVLEKPIPNIGTTSEKPIPNIGTTSEKPIPNIGTTPVPNIGTTTSTKKRYTNNTSINNTIEQEYESFIQLFNRITGRKYKGTDKDKGQFNARIKAGATLADFELAIKAAKADDYLSEHMKYLTPEYITRPGKFDQWLQEGKFKKEVKFEPHKQGS